ncbi:MAG: BatA domain-containing protein [Planctomycetes bacterium]|nr:BatA domain-containing protein [Planctomycetota bacterium]
MHLLNPWFLVGLVAVAVPILIHLLQRHRIRRVVFPATRFLLGASRRITHTQQLREVTLLILRALVIAVAVFALARPFFTSGGDAGAASGGAPGKAAVLVIDVTASMRIGSRMEEARAQALASIADFRPRLDRAAVVVIEAESSVQLPMTDDIDRVRDTVAHLQAGWGRGSLTAALRLSDRLLQAQEYANNARQIIVLSDLQKSGADASASDWRLAAGTTLVVKPVASRPADNIAIAKAVIPQGAVVSQRPGAISLQLRNFGAVDHPATKVVLTMGGKTVAEQVVNLGPGKTEVVRFEYPLTEPGDVAGMITAETTDDFPGDNTWYLDLHVRPRVQVLLVNGGANASLALDDGRFVKESLSLQDSPFTVREIPPKDLGAKDLSGAQAVVFTNVSGISTEATGALKAFLQSGGGALFFCGDRIKADDFNAAFADIAPCRLKDVASKPEKEEGWTLGDIDLTHPIFADFALPQSGDFSTARFARYCVVTDSQSSRVLARFIDGRPALLECALGKGTSLLFTSSAGMAWSDFCLQGGIFVPFVHEALKYVSVHSEGEANVEVGTRFAADGAKTVKAVAILPPGAEPVGAAAQAPGIYRVDADGASTQLAVNLARSESETVAFDAAEVTAALTSEPTGRELTIDGSRVWVAASESIRERIEGAQKIGIILLIGVLILLFAEHLLSNQTSRR